MKTDEAPFFKMLIAFLPILGQTLEFQKGFFFGALVAGTFSFTALFFRMFSTSWPGKVCEVVLFLCVAALAGEGAAVWRLPPLWGMSVWLLVKMDQEDPQDTAGNLSAVFQIALGFWMLAAYLGIVGQVLGQNFQIGIFREPAGALLLLSSAAWFWKNQPTVRKVG